MIEYKVKGKLHPVYNLSEIPDNLSYKKDWRKAGIGDWVLTDDNYVIQILRSGIIARPRNKVKALRYIGTCT